MPATRASPTKPKEASPVAPSVAASTKEISAEQAREAQAAIGLEDVYLDDARVLRSSVGYGSLGLHGQMGFEGAKVALGGTAYSHAVSMHPASRSKAFAEFGIDAPYKRFKAIAGIADSASPHPTRMLIFRVKASTTDVDETTIFESAPMSRTGDHVPIDVALGGDVRGLRIEVEVRRKVKAPRMIAIRGNCTVVHEWSMPSPLGTCLISRAGHVAMTIALGMRPSSRSIDSRL